MSSIAPVCWESTVRLTMRHGWLSTWPLTFENTFELWKALERMTPSQRSILQSITIRDSINLKKGGRETALAKSAWLLRDAAKSLELFRLDYWPEKSLRDDEVAKSIYYITEPLLKAIGEARGVFDAALEVVQFRLVSFKPKSQNYKSCCIRPGAYLDLFATELARREVAIQRYLEKKLAVHPRRSKRIMDHEAKARRQG